MGSRGAGGWQEGLVQGAGWMESGEGGQPVLAGPFLGWGVLSCSPLILLPKGWSDPSHPLRQAADPKRGEKKLLALAATGVPEPRSQWWEELPSRLWQAAT